jgi:predicted phosphodiesterase
MQLFQRVLPKQCEIVFLSDTHVGSSLTHYDGIQQTIEYIGSTKNCFAVVVGDLCEAITTDDLKRFDMSTVDLNIPIPRQQYMYWTDLFKPIRKKILYINDGNHDCKHHRLANFVRDDVCKDLNIPYGTYASKFSVLNSKNQTRFKFYTHHGFGSMRTTADDPIRRRSNLKLALKRKLSKKAADCVLMALGHTHQLLVSEPEKSLYLVDDGAGIRQKYTETLQNASYIPDSLRWYANTGSYLKSQALGLSGYAERAGYDPNELGYILAEIDGDIQCVREVMV